ncbi:unnamed protein product [Lactuca saligna]|uniref:Uncharacterized protein n=1 Tax=Lactuca saligna TaxID=75948 RepID=A0AA36E5C9_LACSI|nr:unnamed protein product [Lactuca saligna]
MERELQQLSSSRSFLSESSLLVHTPHENEELVTVTGPGSHYALVRLLIDLTASGDLDLYDKLTFSCPLKVFKEVQEEHHTSIYKELLYLFRLGLEQWLHKMSSEEEEDGATLKL